MFNCDICGREIHKKIRMGGYTLCSKHMHQLHKYGKFLDNIPRTNSDLNDYRIEGNDAIFNVYNQRNEKTGEFVIDKEDLDLVKYKKWRFSHSHIITGLPYKKEPELKQRELSHVILQIPPEEDATVVDHIDCDPTNNRKSNLRICTQGENVLNKSFHSRNTSGFIGIWYRKDRNNWCPEIRRGKIRVHLGHWNTLEEAVYARLIAEYKIFGEFANEAEQKKKEIFTQNLSQKKKEYIEDYVLLKLAIHFKIDEKNNENEKENKD